MLLECTSYHVLCVTRHSCQEDLPLHYDLGSGATCDHLITKLITKLELHLFQLSKILKDSVHRAKAHFNSMRLVVSRIQLKVIRHLYVNFLMLSFCVLLFFNMIIIYIYIY